MAVKRAVPNVTCLGCGCTCDDMEVLTIDRRIVEARNACALGAAWFGDGVVPQRSSIAGRDVVVDEAIAAASQLLGRATSPLVYLAPDISSETQREAVALADALGAAVDSVTSATALEPLLAFQERGRASATLGELRNRADVIVFWGVDPALRYPRFTTRYAPDPSGLQVVDGRRSRTVIAVDIDAPGGRGPVDADRRLAIAPSDEVGVLTATAAIVAGAVRSDASSSRGDSVWRTAGELAPLLVAAHYAALVADGEAADAAGRDRARSAALIALAQALNGPTRAALCTLRAGGNRSGADAVLTSQTGYPVAVDFTRGYPRYRPYDGTAGARLSRGDVDAAIVIGAASLVPPDLLSMIARVPAIVFGPRASESALAQRGIVVDTGVAGIHESGTALRMDDVPLPLRAVLDGPRSAAALTRALREALAR